MSMSIALRWCALGLCASLCFSGCDDEPDRPYTSIDPSKADPPLPDVPSTPRTPGVSSGNKIGADDPDGSAFDAGPVSPPNGPSDAGVPTDSGALVPRGPGDFLGFDAALAMRGSQ